MRSGFCTHCPREIEGHVRWKMHARCRLAGCVCVWHDQDVRDKAAALVAPQQGSGHHVGIDPGPEFVAPSMALDALPEGNRQEAVVPPPLTMPIRVDDDPEAATSALWNAVKASALAALSVTTEAIGIDSLDAETCLRILYALRAGMEHLRDTEAALVRRIYLAGEHGDVKVSGLPMAKVTRGRERKDWDARGAALAYVDAQMIARDGETPDPAEVASWVLDLCGVNYLRTTQLRAAGLEPKAFCEERPGALSVKFLD